MTSNLGKAAGEVLTAAEVNTLLQFDGSGNATLDGTLTSAGLTSTGNVGIGVTLETWLSSSTALQIGGLGSIHAVTAAEAGAGILFGCNIYRKEPSADFARIFNDPASIYVQESGIHKWYSNPAGTEDVAFTPTNIMELDGSGNLQIDGALTATTGITYGGGLTFVSLDAVNAVSPTAPDRTIAIDVNGTPYYIHAKTTND